eukprot:TRINITY_DN8258_c0_g1_i2.p1 TRINITY_DN8258_c0_g1~~TRINITY_DN8258_c0_g1_i2.p1  ORF type:complete len:116 (+),score=5.12 TRINITY_DN8258_c0_g1_i2:2003-2350(+)
MEHRNLTQLHIGPTGGAMSVWCLVADPLEGFVILPTSCLTPSERSPIPSSLLVVGLDRRSVRFSEIMIKINEHSIYGDLDGNKVFYCLRGGKHLPQILFIPITQTFILHHSPLYS